MPSHHQGAARRSTEALLALMCPLWLQHTSRSAGSLHTPAQLPATSWRLTSSCRSRRTTWHLFLLRQTMT